MKVLIVSDLSLYALGNSYLRGFKSMGFETLTFDLASVERKYIRFGKMGAKIHEFWPVKAWKRKANRELAVLFRKYLPDIVMVFGNAEILFGNLAFFRSIGNSKIILYWPDTLLNLDSYQIEGSSLYDLVATYSSTSIGPLKQIGYKKTLFLPFAGDREFLGGSYFTEDFDYDVSFAGGWRPEREAALLKILLAFPNLKILIKGTDWERFCKNKQLLKYCEPTPVFGKNFGEFIRKSRINLNVIDDTNYPAANMRFFEIPAAGGLQLSSTCPEMESYFKDMLNILYYKNDLEMIDQINWVLNNPREANEIRVAANEKIISEHNYIARIETLVKSLG